MHRLFSNWGGDAAIGAANTRGFQKLELVFCSSKSVQ